MTKLTKGIKAACPCCRRSYGEGYLADVRALPEGWEVDVCPGPRDDYESCPWQEGIFDRFADDAERAQFWREFKASTWFQFEKP